jgi:hypothetical protein
MKKYQLIFKIFEKNEYNYLAIVLSLGVFFNSKMTILNFCVTKYFDHKIKLNS